MYLTGGNFHLLLLYKFTFFTPTFHKHKMKLEYTIKFTEKQIKDLLKNIVITVDSREQKNSHILDYFKAKNINYSIQKHDFADYSFYLPADNSNGISYDIDFTDKLVFERKQNLNELSNNFTKTRPQFENELLRKKDANFTLLIENNSYSDLINHKYNTKYNERSFLATLQTFQYRYNISTVFMPDNTLTGNFIYYSCYYYAREYFLK